MAASEITLRPLPYHQALADYLKTEEPETWAWLGSAKSQSTYADSLRLELLKQTYRLEPATYPEVFAALEDAKAKLGLEIPVTLYQSQSQRDLNASIFCLPGEAHIVFQGGVLQLLDAAELRSVLGHELAHYSLWVVEGGKHLLADRVIHAMANDPRADASHRESARWLQLYTEIYADRGSLQVTGDSAAVISSLVKMQTGLLQVDAASYLRQADEVFSRAKIKTDQLSHPETFIRARAVTLWATGEANVDEEVARMIQGEVVMERLDLIAQQRFTDLTRRWLRLYLRPAWFRTDAVRGQAKLFFADFDFAPEGHTDPELLEELRGTGLSVRDYFCYLLLDFVAVDYDLELEPLRAAFALAAELGWDGRIESLAVKELKMKKREAQELRAEVKAAAALAAGTAGGAESGDEPTDEEVADE
jgi:hypothetical protein